MGPVPLKTVPLNASGTQRRSEFGGVGRGGRGGIGAPPLPVSVDLRLFETGGWGENACYDDQRDSGREGACCNCLKFGALHACSNKQATRIPFRAWPSLFRVRFLPPAFSRRGHST